MTELPEEPKAITKIAGYATSRDYQHLLKLMRTESIVCIVDYRAFHDCRDVAQTIYQMSGKQTEYFQILARGTGYVHACDEADFIKQCEHNNVEFVLPVQF